MVAWLPLTRAAEAWRRIRQAMRVQRYAMIGDATPSPSPQFSGFLPDWPIRDLFKHIRPDLGDRDGNVARDVAADVSNRFGTGQLLVWGNEIPAGAARQLPLAPIHPSYWQDARFDFDFLRPDRHPTERQAIAIRTRDPPLSDYANLLVSRTQALSIWPETGVISLPEAAKRAYKELEHTEFMRYATRGCANEEEILDVVAEILSNRAPTFGLRLRSGIVEQVSLVDRRHSRIVGGGSARRDDGGDSASVFRNLEMRRADLSRVIDNLRYTAPLSIK